MRQQALEYAALGYSIIPLRPKDKRPLLRSWAPYQERVASEDEINQWFDRCPDANIAIVTGRGLAVIDIDGANNPWPGPDCELPAGAVSRTGGGGRQYFLQVPDGADLGNSVSKLAPHVDIRADGGYVVAPPSVHPLTGETYLWLIPLTVPVAELGKIPGWVLDILDRSKRRVQADPAENDYAGLLQGVSKGQRNDAAATLAGHFFARGAAREEVEALLWMWNGHNDPPLPQNELCRTIQSIAERELLKQAEIVPADPANITDEQRHIWLEQVSAEINIPLTGTYRIEGDSPQLEIHTHGGKVAIPLTDLYSASALGKAMMKAVNRLPLLPRKKYNSLVNRLLASAKVVESAEEATLHGQISGWMSSYLEMSPPCEVGEGGTYTDPVIYEARIWINSTKFLRFCRVRFDFKEDARKFSQDLIRFGFTFRRIRIRLKQGGGSRPMRMYQVPEEMLS